MSMVPPGYVTQEPEILLLWGDLHQIQMPSTPAHNSSMVPHDLSGCSLNSHLKKALEDEGSRSSTAGKNQPLGEDVLYLILKDKIIFHPRF